MLKEQGKTVVLGDARLENREALFAEIDRVKPTHILNAAGITGRCVVVLGLGCGGGSWWGLGGLVASDRPPCCGGRPLAHTYIRSTDRYVCTHHTTPHTCM